MLLHFYFQQQPSTGHMLYLRHTERLIGHRAQRAGNLALWRHHPAQITPISAAVLTGCSAAQTPRQKSLTQLGV